ncbi:MAG TPA: wax ester/triacylglycerol synthase family O-acyltransferase [Trebonia sp.]|nr:wax ester/triacylglycerol synthase family O-acyltransferase [Trebonia sp.]
MDRLKPLDAMFIEAEDEDENTSMAIASIAVFQGPALAREEVMALIADRLPSVPRYRQKLRTVPFRLGWPVWVDDPDFDLGRHVRRAVLPAPGEYQQLAELIGRVMSRRLDRGHPLWEYWVVEGLARDRWALISKVHHCMIDGVGGADLYRVVLDLSAEPGQPSDKPPAGPPPAPPAPPSSISLAALAAADLALLPLRQARALGAAVADPRGTIRGAAGLAQAVARFSPSLRSASPSSLSGDIGRRRRYAWTRASLEDIKTIKREFGGTVNDVVLAAISSGFRALLLDRGEEPTPHEVPSLVPVSIRPPGQQSGFGNRVSATVSNLPVHIADPVERLAAVRAEQDSLKASHEAIIGQALEALSRYSAYPVASWLVRKVFGLPQREIVTVTTNVPGPREPLYWMGRRLEEIIPYVPIASTVRTGISIFSYDGEITFGITADYRANPDLEVLARGIEHGVAELLLAARQHAMPAAS